MTSADWAYLMVLVGTACVLIGIGLSFLRGTSRSLLRDDIRCGVQQSVAEALAEPEAQRAIAQAVRDCLEDRDAWAAQHRTAPAKTKRVNR